MAINCDHCGEEILPGEDAVELKGDAGPLRLHGLCLKELFEKVTAEDRLQ